MKLPDKKFILEDVKIRSFIKVNFSGKIVLGYFIAHNTYWLYF